MIGQVLILGVLYLVGFLFIALFYPKVNLFIAATTALFWGALVNTLFGILLGLLGWYSWVIWIMFAVFTIAVLIIHIHRKEIWQQAGWKTILTPLMIMIGIFAITYLATGGNHRWMTSSASLPYLIYGSHIYHYGSILLPGAGYFFRSHYGISEALIHSLGGFIDTPAMTIWHPLLWASQFAFIAAAFYDLTAHFQIRSNVKNFIGAVVIIWSATASMNWFYSFYIHVHLLTTISILVFTYFFVKIIHSEESVPDFGLLGALSLLLFGLCRVESPIIILFTLAILATQKEFSQKEIRSTFLIPLIGIILWITFLFFGYRFFETDFWSDSRLLLALGAYCLFLMAVLVWQYCRIRLTSIYLSRMITLGLLAVPLILAILNLNKLALNVTAMIFSMTGSWQQPGSGVWNFHFSAAGLVLLSILAISRPWQRKPFLTKNYTLIVHFMLSYWMAILVLGFIRQVPYDGSRWGDSASRMISHLAPLMALFIGVWLVEIIGNHNDEAGK